ncbi:MAG TPA: hypothetical protein VK864_12985, partial [Longimicrobiales bacterium]|nr:hypothetical protein [Longimicrobiales bacterium]
RHDRVDPDGERILRLELGRRGDGEYERKHGESARFKMDYARWMTQRYACCVAAVVGLQCNV